MEVVEERAGEGGAAAAAAAAEGGAKCGRWNPTAEQVRLLTELFQAGLRTPSADQIQTISARLSAFGKIESKNVFYWFQNHKARERHHKKRRRQAAAAPDDDHGDHFKLRSRCFASNCGKTSTKRPETLELFPLKACSSGEEKVVCGRALFWEKAERDPPLELRLSFM